jgi:hypothetical protein
VENWRRNKGLQSIANILQQTLFSEGRPAPPAEPQGPKAEIEHGSGPTGRYDFDLAEFPFFHSTATLILH